MKLQTVIIFLISFCFELSHNAAPIRFDMKNEKGKLGF